MEIIKKTEQCKGCEGSGLQIQDDGPMRGAIRVCPECSLTFNTYQNNYGTDQEENPMVYVDNNQIKKITNKDINRKYIIMPDGTEREIII